MNCYTKTFKLIKKSNANHLFSKYRTLDYFKKEVEMKAET